MKAFTALSPHSVAGGESPDVASSGFSPDSSGISGVVSSEGGADNPVSSGTHVGRETTSSTQSSTASTILSDAGSFAESLLGPIPGLINGLIGLFGGSDQKPAYTFPKYEMNAPIGFEAADNGNGQLTASDYGQNGNPREFASASSPGDSTPSAGTPSSASSSPAAMAPAAPAANSGHTFHINLAGLDAQSLMDNSDAIGQAVRASILRLGSIGDAIGEISS
jgi:hypothetical protein